MEGEGREVVGTTGGTVAQVFTARLVPWSPGSVTGPRFLMSCMCAPAFIQAILFLLGKPILLPLHGSHPFVLPRTSGDEGAMATVGLSQHLFDCALLMLQKAGSLNLEITGQLVRAGSAPWSGGRVPCSLFWGHSVDAESWAVGSWSGGYRMAAGRNPWVRSPTHEAKQQP